MRSTADLVKSKQMNQERRFLAQEERRRMIKRSNERLRMLDEMGE